MARINAGGPEVSTPDGKQWSADEHFDGGKTFTNGQLDVGGTTGDVIYQSERSATTELGGFGYDIPVSENGTYKVRLHMAEIYWGATGGAPNRGGIGKRVFSANMEGGSVELSNYDLTADVGAATASMKAYDVPVSDGELNIDFTASANRPTIGGIEVIVPDTTPADTTPPQVESVTPQPDATDIGVGANVTATFSETMDASTIGENTFTLVEQSGAGVNATVSYDAQLKKAVLDPASTLKAGTVYVAKVAVGVKDRAGNNLAEPESWSFTTREPVTASQEPVRINAGGTAQTVNGASWQAYASKTGCSGYVSGGFGIKWNSPSVTGAVSPANAAIYQAEWTGGEKGPSSTVVPKGSIAFAFDVPIENGDYKVRLHFAEVTQNAAGKRTFDVNIEGGTKELVNFDIYETDGGKNKAIVEEFNTTVNDGKMTIDFIRQIENAKIDGIEILPASNSTGTGGTS